MNEANATISDGDDCGFKAFMNSVDTLVMGRKTYEQVLSFGKWPYGRTPVVVLSRKSISFPPGVPNTVIHSSGPPRDLYKQLSVEGIKHLYIDGGVTIQGFLSEGLVDEITVTMIPVILGGGIPLFGAIGKEFSLTHLRTTVFDFGFVQTTYSVKKSTKRGKEI